MTYGLDMAARLAMGGALLLAAGCSADPPPGETTRAMQSNMQPAMTPDPGPNHGLPPVTAPTGGRGGASSPGGSPAPAGDSGAPGDAAAGDPADAGNDAGPSLTECADEDAGADLLDDSGSAITCLAIGDLHVQYKAADTNPTDQQIKPHFNLVNHGMEVVPLSELTLRYWYTRDSTAAQAFNCDYALIGCEIVSGAFSATARQGADQYFELSFASGTLAPGAQTGEIQVRFNNEGWAAYSEGDDYSFDPAQTAFADTYKATLYRRGQLVWGAEPPETP